MFKWVEVIKSYMFILSDDDRQEKKRKITKFYILKLLSHDLIEQSCEVKFCFVFYRMKL